VRSIGGNKCCHAAADDRRFAVKDHDGAASGFILLINNLAWIETAWGTLGVRTPTIPSAMPWSVPFRPIVCPLTG
jgi:hypothetical protein